ncbi:MAG: hypothetical protein KBT69_01260 [Oceanihabitans sp.]|nr:hypothetical protein [Oceanihabitans sp.]
MLQYSIQQVVLNYKKEMLIAPLQLENTNKKNKKSSWWKTPPLASLNTINAPLLVFFTNKNQKKDQKAVGGKLQLRHR